MASVPEIANQSIVADQNRVISVAYCALQEIRELCPNTTTSRVAAVAINYIEEMRQHRGVGK